MTPLELYRWLSVSRHLEAALCAENPRWFPAAGEEATIVGAFCDLRSDDAAAPHYRGPFVTYLMRGAEMWRLCAQALGRRDGYNRGRSVPFTGPADLGFVPWVAGDLGTTIGVATGAALAFQQERSSRACVCSFGDGTANRGDVHEALNLAACWRLPIVYVCQHNGWSISQAAASYLPSSVIDRAAGYGIPGVLVDGNDVEAVRAVVSSALERARRGGGPTLIEARTWRAGGHWAGDPAAYRPANAGTGFQDPLDLMESRLVTRGDASADALAAIRAEVAAEVACALARARQSPEPTAVDLDAATSPLPERPSEAPQQSTRRVTYMDAVVEAVAGEMRRDERVFLLGQDIGPMGGPLQSARGLHEEFGPSRVRETPISESAMVGAALGAAMFGQRPVVELSFGEFLPAAMNQLVNQAPNVAYMTDGRARLSVVVRTRVGDGPYRGHPQDYSAWFAHIPGWTVVMPATPADAKGLMAAAIRSEDPVLFVEPMSLVHAPRGDVPVGECLAPIGVARVARPGRDVTLVAVGSMLPPALTAAERLARDAVEVEVIDPRSLRPWDAETVLGSVRRTGRLVTAHEAWVDCGFGAEVVATVAERCLGDLLAPPVRVGAAPVPIPSGLLRAHALPNADAIVAAVRRVMAPA